MNLIDLISKHPVPVTRFQRPYVIAEAGVNHEGSMDIARRLIDEAALGRKMDHSMIYVLIAGSYTPFCVVLLTQPRGTQFCLILWGVALAGVLAKMLWINAPRMLSTAVYLIMGWSVVFVAKDFTALGQPSLI